MITSSPETREQSEELPFVQTPGRRTNFEETMRSSTTAQPQSGIDRRATRRPTIDTIEEPEPVNPVAEPQKFLTQISTTLSSAAKPDHNLKDPPRAQVGLRAAVTASWLNVLLVFIPVSWALKFAKPDSHTLVFAFAFLAIVSLAKLLAFATDELSMRFGQPISGFLIATLGNAIELIVAIIALTKCQLQVVQSSLVGSILSNLLLVLGMCFFAGGTRFSEQGFGSAAAQINSSLLTLSVTAVLVPVAFNKFTADAADTSEILSLSHGVAFILLFMYFGYIIFQLWSHGHLYEDRGSDVKRSTSYKNVHRPDFMHFHDRNDEDEDEAEVTPQMSMPLSIVLVATVTALIAVTAVFLVDSIDGLTESGVVSKEFVGLILLPIVGNVAGRVNIVAVSLKDKSTLSMGVAVGSSIQIALFVIPFVVILAWIVRKPLTLLFDPFESITLFLAVLTANYAIADGKSNWLKGLNLISLYVILGVSFWYYHPQTNSILAACH